MIEVPKYLQAKLHDISAPVEPETTETARYWIGVEHIELDRKTRLMVEYELQDATVSNVECTVERWYTPDRKEPSVHGWITEDNLKVEWQEQALQLGAIYALQTYQMLAGTPAHFAILDLRLTHDYARDTKRLFAEAARVLGTDITDQHLEAYAAEVCEAQRLYHDSLSDWSRFYAMATGRSAQAEDIGRALGQGRMMLSDLDVNTASALKDSFVLDEKPTPDRSLN